MNAFFGVGIDLVELDSVLRVYNKHGHRFVKRILAPNEELLFIGKNEIERLTFLAGRFCVKEAILKALGTGFQRLGPRFRSLEVLPDSLGRPRLSPSCCAHLETLTMLGQSMEWSVSISHHRAYATAVAMWMRKPPPCQNG